MKILFLFRKSDFDNLKLSNGNENVKDVTINLSVEEKNENTNKISTTAKKNTIIIKKINSNGELLYSIIDEIELNKNNMKIILENNEINSLKINYIAFHPPGSKSNAEYEKDVNKWNQKFDKTIKLTFFSIGNDKIKTLDRLIEKVRARIDKEDKIPEGSYNLRQQLSALKKVLEYNQNIIDKTNDDIKKINMEITKIKIDYIKLENIQGTESIITQLSKNITLIDEYLKTKEKIYDKSY